MQLEEYIQKVENGARPKIDFIKRTFKLNGKEVEVSGDSVDRPLEEIEKLYANFKRSYPSERSNYHLHDYFKALPADELTDEELVVGEERTVARAKLEASFLCWVMNGCLKWHDETKWFWICPNEPDLVILRKWVEQ